MRALRMLRRIARWLKESVNLVRGPCLVFCSASEVDEPASRLLVESGFVMIFRLFRMPVPFSAVCLDGVAVVDRMFGATHDASEIGAL